jgi:FkbM family methyltransferase
MDLVEELVGEGVEACRARESRAFDRLAQGTDGLVLFGAGGLGKKLLGQLRAVGIEPVAFADNNPRLWGTEVESLKVLSPADAAERFGACAAFVVSIWASWADRMVDQISSLRDLGCRTVIPFPLLLWKFPSLLPHVQVDLPSRVQEQAADVRQCYDLWADEASREEYAIQLRWRLFSDFNALKPAVPWEYFQRDLFALGPDAVFVDAGAFDGDTLSQFIEFTGGRFGHVFAFEPDADNIARLKARIAALPLDQRARVTPMQAAVSDWEGSMPFSGGKGAGSQIGGAASGTCTCVRLDNAVSGPVSFMKLDVEGFEPQAIAGARSLISRHRPVLAVCVYHVQDHLWKLPLLIHSISPEYRFYLRPHGQIWESVCYAVPK